MFKFKVKYYFSFLSFLFVLQLICVTSNAQNFTLSGVVLDEKNEPLVGATISLLQLQDSTAIALTNSDINGNFKLENLKAMKFILKISYIGYNSYFDEKQILNKPISLPPIILYEKTSLLGEVKIIENINATQVRGDTTEYNAAAFKTNVDANAEDLVNKMPGVETVDGKVQAQGEDLKKVLVDGKPFFGEDPNAVLKNLPAEMIDKIQIFDGRSEQSQFTGFDDGNAIKTMNIITKPQYKDSVFGKVYGGFGSDKRYKGGFGINVFNGEKKLTILCNSNNINEQNFSAEDLQPIQGNTNNTGQNKGGRQGGKGGQSADENNFLINQKNGINTTQAFGVNFTNKWNKLDFTTSYFVNFIDNESFNNKVRENFSAEAENINYFEQNALASNNLNHRINARIDWKIDTLHSILFQPKISYQSTSGNSFVRGENNEFNNLISKSNSKNNNKMEAINLSIPVLYKHRFAKKGRTASVNFTPSHNNTDAEATLQSETISFGDSVFADTLDQESEFYKFGSGFNGNISYTEPLSTTSQLLVSASNAYNQYDLKKETYNLNNQNDRSLDDNLSNHFFTKLNTKNFGATYSYTQKIWNFSTGLTYQIVTLDNKQIFPDNNKLNRTFRSFLPNSTVQIKFTEAKNLRMNYRTNNTPPNAEQLQNVINNNNPLQLSTGNPLLKQNFQNSGSIRYTQSNTEKNTSFFAMLGTTITRNYFANSTVFALEDSLIAPTIILLKGGQFTQPVNMNGYYTLRAYANMGLPLNKLKCKLNLNGFTTYTNIPSLINLSKNNSKNLNLGGGLSLTSNISKEIDFTISTNTSFGNIKNTLQNELNNKSFNQNSKLKITAMPWKHVVIQTDINHQYNNGLSDTFTRNYLLWNAAIGYKFLKDDIADLRINIYDVLKQNDNISRITNETYFEDTQSNVLQSYFMLTFTYNLRYFKNRESENEQ